MVAYTITPSDVDSVDPDSALVSGVTFDYDNQEIIIPATVSFIDAQWLVDHARFVESTAIGITRKAIIDPFGKYTKGIDPITGLPVQAGIECILLDDWLVVTAKNSGVFVVRDIFKPDGSYPIKNNPLVQIQYTTSQGLSLVQLSTATVTNESVANAVEARLTDEFSALTTLINSVLAIVNLILAAVDLVVKSVRNRYKIGDNQGILYDDDNVTPLVTFNLKDKDGNPTNENVYERVPE